MPEIHGKHRGAPPIDTTMTSGLSQWHEPPLGREGVATLEAENGVVFPEPYRALVGEIGNGSGH
ncbi:hypothetical protein ACF1BS_08380 [Streptomyces sp. NPDC014748]|uniref:hypothetical protein n=1 Tax=Streptomyces sp. NPDC014748 TaxID=3364905 RepID=UPI0036F58F58